MTNSFLSDFHMGESFPYILNPLKSMVAIKTQSGLRV